MHPFIDTLSGKFAALAASALGALSIFAPAVPPAAPPAPAPFAIGIAYSAPAYGTFPVAPSAGQVLGEETSDVVTHKELDERLYALRQDVATLAGSLIVQLSWGQSQPSFITESQYESQIDSIYRAISRSSSGGIADFSSLTAADIPALDYLPLSGGALAGTLTVSATSTLAGITLNADCSALDNGGKLTADASGNVVCADDIAGSGSGTPGGSSAQVQFNDAGDFGGDAGFTYNSAADRLTVGFASTTAVSADYVSTAGLAVSGIPSALLKTVGGVVSAAVAGTDYLTSADVAAYPFPSNATSTLITFSGGLSGSLTGNASTATALETPRAINGVTFDGTADITVAAASSTLLANNNTFSGTNTFSNTVTGSITGNAGTVTNGVYTTTFNSLFDPRFVTQLAATSSVASIITLPNLSLPYGQLTGTPAIAAYPFVSNATSTRLTFSGGLLSLASTTVGSGGQASGLTVSGGATTTGSAYIGGNLGIGVSAPSARLDIGNAGGVKLANGLYSGQLKSSDTSVGLDGLVVRTGDDAQYGSLTLSGLLAMFNPIISSGGGFMNADLSEYRTLFNQDNIGTVVTASGGQYSWSSATGFGFSGTGDTGLARLSAAVVKVTDGSTGFGSLVASSVGLGTTTPGSILSVNGVANFSPATSTFYSTGGINLAGGCFAVNGACLSAGGALAFSYPFASNATTTQLTFNGGLLSLASTTIGNGTAAGGLTISGNATTSGNAYFGSGIAVGTTSPSATFAVTGSGYFSGGLKTGSIVSSPTTHYWADTGAVNNVGVGGRLFVGSNYRNTGHKNTWDLYLNGVASWIDGEATMGYYDTRSQLGVLSGQGRVAIAASSRSSDNVDGSSTDTAAIGVAAFALNNSTSTPKKTAWAFYGHATHLEDNRFTTAMELDTNSYKPLVNVSPYLMGSDGTTAGLWLGVGGEDAAYVAAGNTYHGYTADDIEPVSVALGIVNSVSAIADNVFAKGIVIQDGALLEDANNRSIWAQIADGQMLDFKYGGGASSTVGQIFSQANGGSPNNQTHLVFAKTGLDIRGVKSTDYMQENKLLQLIAPATSGDTNYFVLTPGVAGSNAVTFAATGTDATVNISLMPKSGGVGIGTSNPLGTFDAASTRAAGVGGIGLVSRDTVNANSNPFIYSYKVGGSGGAAANLGLNVYFNSSGVGGQRINSSKNGWAFYSDTRSTSDASFDLQQVSSSGTQTTVATFAASGNFGIGTTTPGSLLSVGNSNGINFSTATSTFNTMGGINIASGCFAVNGTCITAGGGSGAAYPFALAGNATSTLTQFNGGLTAFASSTIGDGIAGLVISGNATTTGNTYLGGTVGVGTNSPLANFEVYGTASTIASYVTATNAGGQAELQVRNSSAAGSSNALRVGVFGASKATSGGFIQNGGFIDSGPSLAGGLSVMARASAGALRFYTGGSADANERLRITSAGNVGLGTTSPSSRLTVWGSDAASSTLSFNIVNSASSTVFAVFNGGNAQLSGTLTQSSDARLKKNVVGLDASTTLAALEQLDPVTFNWIDRSKGSALQIGFIAQDVQRLFPDLVSTTSPTALTPNGTLGVNYIGFIAPIIKGIQALAEQVKMLASAVTGFAESFTSKEVHATDQLCVGSTCVTEAQLQRLLAGQGMQGSAPAPAPEPAAPEEPSSEATSTPQFPESDDAAADEPPASEEAANEALAEQAPDSSVGADAEQEEPAAPAEEPAPSGDSAAANETAAEPATAPAAQ